MRFVLMMGGLLVTGCAASAPVQRSSFAPLAQADLAACGFEDAVSPTSQVVRAIFVGRRLWVATDDGRVRSVAPAEATSTTERIPPTLDLCDFEGSVTSLSCGPGGGWEVWKHQANGWIRVGGLTPRAKEKPLALSCSSGAIRILTSQRAVTLTGSLHSVALQPGLPWFPHAQISTRETSDWVYVGLNAGEWGGGVRRVSLSTGAVEELKETAPGATSDGGVLEAAFDPVTALAEEPWKPECLVAAVGQLHVAPQGGLVEICGTRLTPIVLPEGAIVGLAGDGDALLAARVSAPQPQGWQGARVTLSKVTPDGNTELPFPPLRDAGGLQISFAIPGAVLIDVRVGERSGDPAIPMLVPR